MNRAWLALLLLVPTMAAAGVNVSSVSQKHWRNVTSIAVQATVVGDDDTNAVVQIFARRKPSAAFDSGMVMSRRPGTRTYGGRILWLTSGDTADFYIEARDGATVRSVVDTATCTRIPGFTSNGGATDFYANASTGNNTYDGTSATVVGGSIGPKKTIQAAVDAMNGQGAADGSIVHVADGEYHEQVTLSSWTNGYHFMLQGASRDSTIICGANPNVEAGRYDGSNAIAWTSVDAGADSIWKCYFPSNGGPADSTQLIVLGFGEQLHRKTSLLGLANDSTLTAGCASSANYGELSGWFWRNDTLYVKSARTASAPSVTGNHFGYLDQPLLIKSRNWTVSTLTVRYAGAIRSDNVATETAYKNANDQSCGTGCQAGKQNPTQNGHLVSLAVTGDNTSRASGALLYNLHLYGANSALVYGPWFSSGGGYVTDSVYVARCLIDGLTVGAMNFSAMKCRNEESIYGTQLGAQASSIFGNTIQGTANGIGLAGASPADTTSGSFNEYSYNVLRRITDDGFELDACADINVLTLRNSVRSTLSSLSADPGLLGPIFNLYSVYNYTARGAKLGGGNIAPIYWYHDTFYPDSVGTFNSAQRAVEAVGGTSQHSYFRNCIFGARATSGNPTILGLTVADSARFQTNEFNYNTNYIVSGSNIATWAGTSYTLATIRTGLVWEKNGNSASWKGSGAEQFQSPPTYNFRLKKSALFEPDAAVRIAGVNTAFGTNLYKIFPGQSAPAKPDKGAYEFSNKKRLSWWRRTYTHS